MANYFSLISNGTDFTELEWANLYMLDGGHHMDRLVIFSHMLNSIIGPGDESRDEKSRTRCPYIAFRSEQVTAEHGRSETNGRR